MKNAVGREIPDEILKLTGKDVYRGTHHLDGTEFKKDGPVTRVVINSDGSKLVDSIHDALVKCGIKDGMRLGFHHHFRNGDKVLNLVMEEVHKMGIKDITLCASSLGAQNDPILPMIEDGTITNIESSGVRGSIGQAISEGRTGSTSIASQTYTPDINIGNVASNNFASPKQQAFEFDVTEQGDYVLAFYSAPSGWSDCIIGLLTLTVNSYVTDGINDAVRYDYEKTANDNVVYDLQGRKVSSPQKGIYIKNGKKFFVNGL